MDMNENSGQIYQKWSHISETPIFQILEIDKFTNQVKEVPVNNYMEKEQENVKLVFIGNYIYGDHSYKYLPEYKTNTLSSSKGNSDWPAKNIEKFDEFTVPIIHNPDKND